MGARGAWPFRSTEGRGAWWCWAVARSGGRGGVVVVVRVSVVVELPVSPPVVADVVVVVVAGEPPVPPLPVVVLLASLEPHEAVRAMARSKAGAIGPWIE